MRAQVGRGRAALLAAVLSMVVGAAVHLAVPGRPSAVADGHTPAVPRGTADPSALLTDVAAAVGLDFTNGALGPRDDSGATAAPPDTPAMMGGGVCWLDADGDGWMDLYLVNTWAEADHARWVEGAGLPTSTLYRNDNGTFADVGTASGAALQVRGQGCLAADLDGDGATDLYVTTDRTNVLLWNDGDGTFTRDDGSAGLDLYGWHTGAAAGDVDGDGLVDVVVGGYVDRNVRRDGSAEGFPGSHAPVADRLLRNVGSSGDGRARFLDVSTASGLDADGPRYTLGVQLVDVDADGDPDLVTAADTDPNRLYRNDSTPGHPRLVDVATAAGADDAGSGMGVATGDLDGDGALDLLVTNLGTQGHALLVGAAEPDGPVAFADGAEAVGLYRVGEGLTGWGTAMADLDVDGDLDVVIADGAIPVLDSSSRQPLLAYDAVDGVLRRAPAAWGLDALPPLDGRGLAVADFDNDGDPDIAVQGPGAHVVLLRNGSATGRWLRVDVEDPAPGTRVRVVGADGRWWQRNVEAGGSYLSTHDPRPLFGLGEQDGPVTVEVTWPDGVLAVRHDVEPDRPVTVARPPGARSVPARAGGTPGFVAPSALAARLGPGTGCTPPAADGPSVVGRWIDVALDAIRHDLPDPTVHARNLRHLSQAMFDAWRATRDLAPDVVRAAVAQTAADVLRHRYASSVGAARTLAAVEVALAEECLGGTVAREGIAMGHRTAIATLQQAATDGADTRPVHVPGNPPLVVGRSGGHMSDPLRWQPLQIAAPVTQNGIAQPDRTQRFIGYGWGTVGSVALPPAVDGMPLDPGPPPGLHDADGGAALRAQVVEVLRASSRLDPQDGAVVDTSPGTTGANGLGRDDGTGHPVNPVTGLAYTPSPVARGDLGRALAEFWADGPDSETPPGHWNVIARAVSDGMAAEDRRIGGTGPVVDRLAHDAALHLVLNWALHDAAVAAWGVKSAYDSPRPVSLIRHMGGMGQSSDATRPGFHPDGLPLEPGLIELVDAATTTPGARHAALAGHEGEVAVRTWAPAADGVDGVRWILAADWVPYQRSSFVTPAFAGYVSGHSTFSRAAAEVLAAFTGSPWFPGGEMSWTVPAGSLGFEAGPQTDVVLRWATYADAADQAGLSRIHGGIHITADDHAGRVLGATVGRRAWAAFQAAPVIRVLRGLRACAAPSPPCP